MLKLRVIYLRYMSLFEILIDNVYHDNVYIKLKYIFKI